MGFIFMLEANAKTPNVEIHVGIKILLTAAQGSVPGKAGVFIQTHDALVHTRQEPEKAHPAVS